MAETSIDSCRPVVDETRDDIVNSYDVLPYSVSAFSQTRPSRLAAIARLFGLNAPLPDRCRVLELGCAAGGNLIPMASAAPASQFVGIELSQRQAADAQAAIQDLALSNINVRQMSILEVGPELGQFDYILTHGVYSWVPAAVQDKILQICRQNLSPSGVAYVSYNTYPGWHARGAVREMLWYHGQRFADPIERTREARAFLELLVEATRSNVGGYSALLRQELALLRQVPDEYLLHEHLDDFNDPVYFHQFAERAAGHELQYLGEAHLSPMMAGRFGPRIEERLRQLAPDLLEMEQYIDFACNRMFRQTLLCHREAALDPALRPQAIRDFHIASPLKPTSSSLDPCSPDPMEFRHAQLTLRTSDPLMKAAMLHLAEMWPMPVPFNNLLHGARERLAAGGSAGTSTASAEIDDIAALTHRLLNAYAASAVEFTLGEPAFTMTISERPIASPYARRRANAGGPVTNLRLESIRIGKPSALVLSHLDGQHDRESLVKMIADWLDSQPPAPSPGQRTAGLQNTENAGTDMSASKPAATSEARATRFVEEVLQGFARAALLIG